MAVVLLARSIFLKIDDNIVMLLKLGRTKCLNQMISLHASIIVNRNCNTYSLGLAVRFTMFEVESPTRTKRRSDTQILDMIRIY